MATRILLVEDDQYLRDMYEELLISEGNEVVTCKDGEEGYNAAAAGGFQLVLLDVMLPKMDGIQIMKKLKENKLVSKNGPVVFLSNLSQENIAKEALMLGAAGYLIKSELDPGEVLHEIRTFLKTA